MNQVTNIITLTDKDLLHFNGKEVRIGQYSLVNEAITFLLNQLQSADRASGQAETLVSFAEPNHQLFTIAEVTNLLKDQRQLCATALVQSAMLYNKDGFLTEPAQELVTLIFSASEPESKKLSETRSN